MLNCSRNSADPSRDKLCKLTITRFRQLREYSKLCICAVPYDTAPHSTVHSFYHSAKHSHQHPQLYTPCFSNLFLSFRFLPHWAVIVTIIFLLTLSRTTFLHITRCLAVFRGAAAVANQHPTVCDVSRYIKHRLYM